MSVNELRQYVAHVLREATRIDDKFYSALDAAIASSNFWLEDNGPDDPDYNSVYGEDIDQTPAAEVLGEVLTDYFRSVNYPVIVAVRSPDIDVGKNIKFLMGPDHPNYPDRVVVGGQMGLSDQGRRILYLDLGLFNDDPEQDVGIFQRDDINPARLSKSIGSIVRHELIHALQYDKRSKSEKIGRRHAKKKYEDDGSIVISNNRNQYLSSHIEVDAYAHEFAEELLSEMSLEEALNFIRRPSASDPRISDQFKEYLEGVSSKKALRNLMKKVYYHLMDLSSRNNPNESGS